MDEQRAIRLLKRGNIKGLEFLVKEYQLEAVRTAYLILGDPSAAEDIVQVAFLRVYERIDQFDPERSFRPWFFRMVVNDAVKSMTRQRPQISLEADLDNGSSILEFLMDPEPGPESQTEEVNLRQSIWSALCQLPAEQRAVVVLRYYLDFSEAEIAQQTASPKGTVKWRLHKAHQRLRKLLDPSVTE